MRHQREITVGGKTYLLTNFTPDIGCYWAFKLFGSIAGSAGEGDFSDKITEFTEMPREQFKAFQKDCLAHVLVPSPNGNFPLMNPQGYLTVPEMTGPEAFALTIHSFMNNISDFFDASLLGDLMAGLQEAVSTGESTSTSTPSSTPQSGTGTGANTNFGTVPTT